MIKLPLFAVISGILLLIGLTTIAVLFIVIGIVSFTNSEKKPNLKKMQLIWAIQDAIKAEKMQQITATD